MGRLDGWCLVAVLRTAVARIWRASSFFPQTLQTNGSMTAGASVDGIIVRDLQVCSQHVWACCAKERLSLFMGLLALHLTTRPLRHRRLAAVPERTARVCAAPAARPCAPPQHLARRAAPHPAGHCTRQPRQEAVSTGAAGWAAVDLRRLSVLVDCAWAAG